MDIYRNKASGSYFICVDELGDGSALLITPRGDVKALDLSLFHNHEVLNSSDPRSPALINQEQLERYRALSK